MANGLPGLPPPGFLNEEENTSLSRGLPGLPPPGFLNQEDNRTVNELLGNPTNIWQKAARAGTGQLIKSIPVIGDELFGGLGAAADFVRGKGNTYNQRVEQARDWEKAAYKTSPFISTVGEVASNLAVPFKSGVAAKTGILAKTGQAAKEGATIGSIYGFGEGEGGFKNRAENAGLNAVTGGIVDATLAGTGQVVRKGLEKTPLKDWGQQLQRNSLGTRASDYTNKSNFVDIIELPESSEKEVKSRVRQALDELISSDELGKSRNPEKLAVKVSEGLEANSKKLWDLIGQNNREVEIPFSRTKKLLNSGKLPGDRKNFFKNTFKKIQNDIQDNGKNLLSYVEEQKQALSERYVPDDKTANKFYRAMYHDLQETIEDVIPESKSINKELQKYIIADKIISRGVETKESGDIIKKSIQLARTSGGLGVPALAYYYTDDPKYAALAGAGAYALTNRGKSQIGNALIKSNALGNAITNSSPNVTAGLLSQLAGQEEQETRRISTQANYMPLAQGQSGQQPISKQGAQALDRAQISKTSTSLNRTTLPEPTQSRTDKVLEALGNDIQASAINVPISKREQEAEKIKEVSVKAVKASNTSNIDTSKVFAILDNHRPFNRVLDSLAEVESSNNPKAIGEPTKWGTAKGMYQVLDHVGEAYHKKLGLPGEYDPFDPNQQRIIAGALLLDNYKGLGGDMSKAVLAYHSGIGNVKKGNIGKHGRAYVPKVTAVFERLSRDA